MPLVLQVLLAPVLVAAATLAARRWGERVGGLVSAFPAIAGPVLLIDAHEHGTAFASRAATGTVLGLVALSGFALAYGRTAATRSWRVSLVAGWTVAAALGAAAARTDAGLLVAVAVAAASLGLAHRGLAGAGPHVPAAAIARRWDLPVRLAVTVGLVVGLAAAAGLVGPVAGGVLTALPVLASVLAVFTHRRDGPEAVAALLRGMLAGMAGFGLFCAAVALLVDRAGVGAAFAVATVAAVAAQGLALAGPGASRRRWTARRARPGRSPHPSRPPRAARPPSRRDPRTG